MADTTNKTMYAEAGTIIKICIPIEVTKGSEPNGAFGAEKITINGTVYDLVRGFRVEDAAAGVITPVDKELCVLYEQKNNYSNRVTFHAVDGRSTSIDIVNSASYVHTHQSIAQGGPAFGTYFRDKKS